MRHCHAQAGLKQVTSKSYIDIKPGDIVLDVGTAGYFTYGVLTAASVANYIGFDLRDTGHHSANEDLKRIFKAKNLSQFGGNVQHKKIDFVNYARKNIKDNTARFV